MTRGHREAILDQFTRQAVPFSTSPTIRDEQALVLLVEASGAGPEDTVLDVACGGGNVVCAFAAAVRHATGLDITPAMLDRARALQQVKSLDNVSWRLGDVLPLPFPDAAFRSRSTTSSTHARSSRRCAACARPAAAWSSPMRTHPPTRRRPRRSTAWSGSATPRTPVRCLAPS